MVDLWAQGKARTDYLRQNGALSSRKLRGTHTCVAHARTCAHCLTESSAAKNCMGKHFLRTDLCPLCNAPVAAAAAAHSTYIKHRRVHFFVAATCWAYWARGRCYYFIIAIVYDSMVQWVHSLAPPCLKNCTLTH